MKVLFCTDGSKISYDALENYMNISNSGVIIDVISVIDWSFLPDGVVLEDSGFITSCRNMADNILESAESIIKKYNFKTGVMIKRCGTAVECIIEQLEVTKYDTVIMGSHGKKGIQRWLGSVSREVIESAKAPVYVSKRKQCCKRILFITDGSELSINVAKSALKNLNLKESEIFICSVSENPELIFLNGTFDDNWMNNVQTQQNNFAQQSINSLKEIFKDYKIKESKILTGIPAQSILKYAKEKDINLIIIGSEKKTKIQRFLLDSTSKRIIENTNSDTFINFML